RSISWRPTAPATLVWREALDEGDPKKEVPQRDRVLTLAAPGRGGRADSRKEEGTPRGREDASVPLGSWGEPTELCRTEHRCTGLDWVEEGGLVFVAEYDRDRQWRRVHLLDADRPGEPARLVWDLSTQERYRDPGR